MVASQACVDCTGMPCASVLRFPPWRRARHAGKGTHIAATGGAVVPRRFHFAAACRALRDRHIHPAVRAERHRASRGQRARAVRAGTALVVHGWSGHRAQSRDERVCSTRSSGSTSSDDGRSGQVSRQQMSRSHDAGLRPASRKCRLSSSKSMRRRAHFPGAI